MKNNIFNGTNEWNFQILKAESKNSPQMNN